MIGGPHAARSGHVLYDDPRLPRGAAAELVGDQPGIESKTTSRRIAGDQRHHAILVEIPDRIGMRGQTESCSEEETVQTGQTGNTHGRAPRPSRGGFGNWRIWINEQN